MQADIKIYRDRFGVLTTVQAVTERGRRFCVKESIFGDFDSSGRYTQEEAQSIAVDAINCGLNVVVS